MLEISTHQLLAEVRTRAHGLEHGTRRLIIEMAERLEILDQVDAVPVVRCKDCKHFVSPQGVPCCDEFMGLGFPNPSGDDFCSYGERKSDG